MKRTCAQCGKSKDEATEFPSTWIRRLKFGEPFKECCDCLLKNRSDKMKAYLEESLAWLKKQNEQKNRNLL